MPTTPARTLEEAYRHADYCGVKAGLEYISGRLAALPDDPDPERHGSLGIAQHYLGLVMTELELLEAKS